MPEAITLKENVLSSDAAGQDEQKQKVKELISAATEKKDDKDDNGPAEQEERKEEKEGGPSGVICGKAETASQGTSTSSSSKHESGNVALRKFIAGCSDDSITPPCRTFRLLTLVSDYNKAIRDFESIKTKVELEAVSGRYKLYKGAHKDLTTMAKGATQRLNDAWQRARDAAEAAASKAEKKDKKKARKEAPEKGTYFEVISSSLKIAPVFRLDQDFKITATSPSGSAPAASNDGKPDFRLPCVFSTPPGSIDQTINDVCEKFMKKFLKQAAATGGRAQRSAGSEATPKVMELLSHLMAMIEKQPDSAEMTGELAELAKPACYGVSKGRSTISYETSLLATFRLGIAGTRCVTMAPLVPCIAHLVSHGTDGESAILADMDAAFGKVGAQLKDGLPKEISESAYSCTVGPGDILFLPAGRRNLKY